MLFKAKRIIKRFDLFGAPILLRYKGFNYFRSVFGGVVSLAVTIVAVLLLVYTGYQYATLQHIKASLQVIYEYDHSESLNSSNFFFMATAYDIASESNFGSFNISLELVTQKGSTGFPQMQRCTLQSLKTRVPQYNGSLTATDLYNFYCSPSQFTFVPSLNQTAETYLRLRVFAGNRGTKRLRFYFTNMLINPLSVAEPVSYLFQDSIQYMVDASSYSLSASLSFSFTQLLQNYFLRKSTNTRGYSYLLQERSNLVPNRSYCFQLKLRRSNKSYFYQRRQLQWYQQMSFIGGIISAIYMLGQILVQPYNGFKLKVSLSNQLIKHRIGEQSAQNQKQGIVSAENSADKQLVNLLVHCKKLRAGLWDFINFKVGQVFDLFSGCERCKAQEWAYKKKCIALVEKQMQLIEIVSSQRLCLKSFQILLSKQELILLKLACRKSLTEQKQNLKPLATQGELSRQYQQFERKEGGSQLIIKKQEQIFFKEQLNAIRRLKEVQFQSERAQRILAAMRQIKTLKNIIMGCKESEESWGAKEDRTAPQRRTDRNE